MSSLPPCLTLDGVSCARGGLVVLEAVSFEVSPGEAVVLRGPNGSGKTTLLRTLAGLQPALAGRIDVDADELAYAGHADAVKGTLSVAENLGFWAGLFGQSDITPALEAFDLTALQDRPAQSLSAGQKRRLGLSRMVVTGRPIWLMDEPTVSLDRAVVARFAEVVRSHLSKGGAAVMATHIDLGLEARDIDLTAFRPARSVTPDFDEAFL